MSATAIARLAVVLALLYAAGGAQAQLVLVADSGGDEVVLVDPSTGAVLSRMRVGRGPHELAASADRRRVVVANSGTPDNPGSTVSLIDVPERAPLATFDLGACMPHDLRLGPGDALLWVTCANRRAVAELDARTGEGLRRWETGAEGGWMLAVTPAGGKVYVANLEGAGVSAIDREADRVRNLDFNTSQIGIDVSPDGREVWIAGVDDDTIRVLDAERDSVVATLASGGERPVRVKFTPDGGRALVVNSASRTVSVFDAARREPLGAIELAYEPKVIAIDAAGARAVVSHPEAGAVSVLDLSAMTVQRIIEVGGVPDGVIWVAER